MENTWGRDLPVISAHPFRRATRDDAAGVAMLWAACAPYLVRTAAAVEPRLASSGAALVLDDGDRVTGYADLRRHAPPSTGAQLYVLVHPDARRTGAGSALLARMEDSAASAGVTELTAEVQDDGSATGFAARRGYTAGHLHRFAGCDPRRAPEPPRPAAGVELVTLAELDDVTGVWEAHNATAEDDPSGSTPRMSYDLWLREIWRYPDNVPALGAAALVDGTVASYTMTQADPSNHRAWSSMTGTRPAYRGRGLAKLVKAAALRNAATAGYTSATTGNDLENAPMLAVNAWLGYQETARAVAMTKRLGRRAR